MRMPLSARRIFDRRTAERSAVTVRDDRVPDHESGYPKDLVSIARGPARAFLVAEGFSPEAASEILDGFLQWLEQQPLPHAEMGTDRELRLWLLHSLEDFLVRHDWKPPVTGGGARPERAPDSEAEPCPICGATLRVRGMCGACLLSASLPAPEAPPETDTVENYRLVELLGSGGESNVYRARQSDQDRDVALKILLTECAEEFDAIEQFRDTARLVAKLEHPNIVRIYDRAGLGLKRPYYTMQLVEGGSLADRRAKFCEQRRAARLMIKIARAVQYAHERGVLHQDLKPHNVLVGEDGEPYVTDFMAHPVAKQSLGPRGSYGYMPWEQAAGHGATIASDVYGLGAIFYELLTGRPPLVATSLEEVCQLHEKGAIKSPRTLERSIHRDFETICMAALAKDARRRHRSAALFAESLEAVLNGYPPPWPRVPRTRRFVLWTRRHPLLAAGAFLGLSAVLAADIATFVSARGERQEVLDATLRHNTAQAAVQARVVLALFDRYLDEVAQAAEDPGVRELLARGAVTYSPGALRELLDRSPDVSGAAVFDTEGRMLARFPVPPPGALGKSYDFRDYFTRARALAHQAQDGEFVSSRGGIGRLADFSSTYRGEISNTIEFAATAPVFDESRRWTGFVVMSHHANRSLGDLDIGDTHGTGQVTALLGWRGRDRHSPNPNPPRSLTIVAHPKLTSTEEFAILPSVSDKLVRQFSVGGGTPSPAVMQSLRWQDAAYLDPVTKQHQLAGFAPVGSTGYVVAVGTPHATALGANERHVDSLFRSLLVLNFGFLLVVFIGIWATLKGTRVDAED